MNLQKIAVLIFALSVLAIAAFASGLFAHLADTDEIMPSLHISINAEDIHRHEWREATFSLEGQRVIFDAVPGEIRGRGNSTWRSMGEKRPYRIRFNMPLPMFGSSYAAENWTLLANAMDYSLLRNYAAFYLGRSLMNFAPAGHFVHLYLDGDYRGVYLLSDQVQALPGRVNLREHPTPRYSEFLVEWDNRARPDRNDDYDFHVRERIYFVIDYPRGENLTDAHIAFAQETFHDADTLIRRGEFSSVSQIIDIPSFIDFYLIQELFRNADVGSSSLFFHIRQTSDGAKIFAGPIWDFDFSSGAGLPPDTDPMEYQPQGEWASVRNRWFAMLFETDWFRPTVAERWEEIRDSEVRDMLARISETAQKFEADFERNFERHPHKLGQNIWRVSPSVQAIPNHAGNVTFLTYWLEQRILWMDEFLKG